MTGKFSTAIEYKVWDETDGVSICVRPSSENPDDYTEITTSHSKDSLEHYGEMRLAIPNEMALLLGKALIESSGKS